MKYSVIYIIIFLHSIVFAQTIKIEGTVKDNTGKSLSYVNVYIQDTFDGAMTDESGKFEFIATVRDSIHLIASMIGYEKYSELILPIERSTIFVDMVLQEETVELKEAIISGSSYSSEKEKGLVVSKVDVYTTPGGAADLFQSIKALPGVSQVSESAELYVRGGDPYETLTIVDQAGLYHPYTYESSYGGLFSNLNTAMIKSMFFSSGGFSAKYGNALSGILEIETIDEPATTGYNFSISMAAVSAAARLNLVDNKLGMNVLVNKSYTGPIMWLNGELDNFTSNPSSQDFTASLIYRYSQTGRLKLHALFATDITGVKVERPEVDSRFNGNTDNTFVNLQQKDVIGKNLLIKNSLSFSSNIKQWKLSLLDIEMIDNVAKFRSDLEYSLSGTFKLSAGGETGYRSESFNGRLPLNDYDLRTNGDYQIIDDGIEQTKVGGYIEAEKHELFGVKKLAGIAGIRSDHFPDFNVTWLDPRFTLSYNLNNSSNLNFAFGIFHQIPESRLFSPTDGNPKLQSMKALHFILSFNQSFSSGDNIRAELYYKKYYDLPLEDEITNYSNKGYGYASGLDIIFKGSLPFDISGWLSYGFLHTKRLWMDYNSYTRSDFDITHQLTVIAKYNYNSMLQFGINFKLASGRPYTPITGSDYSNLYGIYEPEYGMTNSARYPLYKRLDFRITHFSLLFDRYNTIIYMEALNILNVQNIFGYTHNREYNKRYNVKSYFGRRTIVLGANINI